MMKNCAEFRGFSVFFQERKVLDSISLDIPQKGITMLLGRSGSGKTTLLRSLNRLNETFEGCRCEGEASVLIGGEMVNIYEEGALSLTELRRRVGMVFQIPNPLPLSVKKNMLLPMQLVLSLGKKEAEARMEQRLKEVGLWDEVKERLNTSALSLSGGQQQRLCLARALALEPDILLLDEPTASLDKKSSELIEDHLLSLKGRCPMVMVSHSISQAQRLGERFVVISEGKITKIIGRNDIAAHEGQRVLTELL